MVISVSLVTTTRYCTSGCDSFVLMGTLTVPLSWCAGLLTTYMSSRWIVSIKSFLLKLLLKNSWPYFSTRQYHLASTLPTGFYGLCLNDSNPSLDLFVSCGAVEGVSVVASCNEPCSGLWPSGPDAISSWRLTQRLFLCGEVCTLISTFPFPSWNRLEYFDFKSVFYVFILNTDKIKYDFLFCHNFW